MYLHPEIEKKKIQNDFQHVNKNFAIANVAVSTLVSDQESYNNSN